MSILKKPGRGFTLLEMLIALAISSFLMLGVYSAFSGVVSTRDSLENANNDLILLSSLKQIISKDIQMMRTGAVQNLPVDIRKDQRVMAVITQNSLNFNKSLAVDVIYYVEDNTLYRLERHTQMNYSMRLPLLRNVDEWSAWTFDGSEYREDVKNNGHIFKFNFKVDGRVMEFVTGRAVSQ